MTDLAAHPPDLTEYLLTPAPVDLTDEEAAERWQIDDDNGAQWALGIRANAEAEKARIDHRHDRERARLDEWHRMAAAGPLRTIEVMDAKLIDYRRALEAANPRLPLTYRLPGGAVKRRKATVRTVVTDEPALVAWCSRFLPDALKVTVLRSDVAKVCLTTIGDQPGTGSLITDDGEVVPGVEQVRPADFYSVVSADPIPEPF
jgi:hypothetical protein